ncbi:hypothetical protein OAR00_00180 [Alphaproteobacteria bacterium]|nr:hypothetical protein [Alphaproteobacteria bacterium]MDC1022950.1 hypothetical protein [Alphaproteobacteria bacterium]
MGQLIKIDFSNLDIKKNIIYKDKLIRIRDEIESYLILACTNEDDELAVALAAGRFAAMKLTQLTGEKETKSFINECIQTTLKN